MITWLRPFVNDKCDLRRSGDFGLLYFFGLEDPEVFECFPDSLIKVFSSSTASSLKACHTCPCGLEKPCQGPWAATCSWYLHREMLVSKYLYKPSHVPRTSWGSLPVRMAQWTTPSSKSKRNKHIWSQNDQVRIYMSRFLAGPNYISMACAVYLASTDRAQPLGLSFTPLTSMVPATLLYGHLTMPFVNGEGGRELPNGRETKTSNSSAVRLRLRHSAPPRYRPQDLQLRGRTDSCGWCSKARLSTNEC